MSIGATSLGGETKVAFSDAAYRPAPGQEEGPKIGKMYGKPGIQKKNLWAIPAITFFTTLTGSTVIQSMTYILQDPEFYNLPEDRANDVSANSFTIGQIVTIPIVLVAGFLYDNLGRKPTTVGTMAVGVIATVLTPLVSPYIGWYDFCRILFVAQLTVVLSNPFVNDYA